MSNKSWRHHYIPQFYLKGFTNTEGKFKIYDVDSKQFIKNGKWFSPESYFFEKDGNSFVIGDDKDDFLEVNGYKEKDQEISNLFNKIHSSKPDSDFGLNDSDMPMLQYFVGIMYWRVPQNFERIHQLVNQRELKHLGLFIKNEKGDRIQDKEFELRLKNDPNFIKAMKLWIPTITLPSILNCDTPLYIRSLPDGLPCICSDNPIIFKATANPDLYKDDFIFPLTNKLLFIRSKKINNILTDIKVAIDLIILKQAKKYVSCTNELYIVLLETYYKDNYSSIEELKAYVFKELLE